MDHHECTNPGGHNISGFPGECVFCGKDASFLVSPPEDGLLPYAAHRRNPHQDLVSAFHEKFSIPVRAKPGVPSDERVRLRLRLIAEEFEELIHACLDVRDEESELLQRALRRIVEREPVNVLLPEAVDALADLEYVIHGTSCEFGVEMGPVFAEVHRSNCTKHAETNEFGKITKGPNYEAPDIEGALKAQGWEP